MLLLNFYRCQPIRTKNKKTNNILYLIIKKASTKWKQCFQIRKTVIIDRECLRFVKNNDISIQNKDDDITDFTLFITLHTNNDYWGGA